MPQYSPGDVVLAAFPFEDTSDTKPRPVVIIEAYPDASYSCMITGTNRSHLDKGFWILKDSDDGKAMKLKKDSFVNANRCTEIKNCMIFKKMGECPFIEKLERLINE